jgi:hypothetical protein
VKHVETRYANTVDGFHRVTLRLGVTGALALAACSIGPAPSSPTPIATLHEGPSPVQLTPSPSPTPTAPSGLVAGAYARVTADGLRIRVAARTNATPVGALFFGDVVKIRSDAASSGGYHWYEIETVQTANDQQLTGFIAGAKGDESYLEPMSGPPSPTPPRSPSPSPSG